MILRFFLSFLWALFGSHLFRFVIAQLTFEKIKKIFTIIENDFIESQKDLYKNGGSFFSYCSLLCHRFVI